MQNHKRTILPCHYLLVLILLLFILIVAETNMGALSLSYYTLLQLPTADPLWHIWLNIRLPRVFMAVIVGMALATSGVVMQGVFRNPLADPGLLGISSGASLFVGLLIIIPISLPSIIAFYGQMIVVFIGGTVVCIIIYMIHRHGRGSTTKLLLTGIAINTLVGAIMGG